MQRWISCPRLPRWLWPVSYTHLDVYKRQQLGGERPECDGSQDHDLFLRLLEKAGGAAHVPQVLYYWRVHAGSTSCLLYTSRCV